MEKAIPTLEPDQPMKECVDEQIEAFLNDMEAFEKLPRECKRIDPEKEIEIQKWILRMTLEEA